MRLAFRTQSIRDLVRYNRALLLCCVGLSTVSALLCIRQLTSDERIILVPMHNTTAPFPLSSKGYTEPYLKEWALYIMQALMTTSHETVDRQIAELKEFTSPNIDLDTFCDQHAQFIKGSRIEMVFFPKKATVQDDQHSVEVRGTFRYWMGSKDHPVSQEKSYRLHYKRGLRDIIFLTSVEEVAYA